MTEIKALTELANLSLQPINTIRKLGIGVGWCSDEPTHTMHGFRGTQFLKFAESPAHSHLCDAVFFGECSRGCELIPGLEAPLVNVLAECGEYTPPGLLLDTHGVRVLT